MAMARDCKDEWAAEEIGALKALFTCNISNVSILKPNQQIVLTGIKCKTADKVEGVSIDHSNSIAYFPLGLDIKFPNLIALEMKDCGLRQITRNDLKGLGKLKELSFYNNRIKDLPDNLFSSLQSLEIVDFYNNSIETISEQLLSPLKNLKYCDLRNNINVNLRFVKGSPSKGVSLDEMNREIKERCQPFKDPVHSYIQRLWEGNYSDFIIKVEAKEFKVHKSILSVNIPSFAAAMNIKMEEGSKKGIVIVDFSADVVESFLEFIYLRKIPEAGISSVDLYKIAAKYQVEELKEISKTTLLQSLSPDNAYEIFLLGHLHDDEFLKSQAFLMCSKVFGGDLPQKMMNHPERIKNLLEAKAAKDSKIAHAEMEWSESFKQLTNDDDNQEL